MTQTPYRMCGMCNVFPNGWNSSSWRCGKIQAIVEAADGACEHWVPREDWKIDPPMYSRLVDRQYAADHLRRVAEPLPLEPEPPVVCYVYFIQAGDYVKIGHSHTPKSRLQSIATSTPLEVKFLGLVVGGPNVEKDLHRQYAGLRHAREWFKLTDELRAEIIRLCGRGWKKHLRNCG